MKVSIVIIATLCALFMAKCSFANDVKDFSWKQKVHLSDVVVIAEIKPASADVCLKNYACGSMDVLVTLKGAVAKGSYLLYDGPIVENRPWCCVVGVTYLLFLERFKKDGRYYYRSVNGPYGIFILSTPRK